MRVKRPGQGVKGGHSKISVSRSKCGQESDLQIIVRNVCPAYSSVSSADGVDEQIFAIHSVRLDGCMILGAMAKSILIYTQCNECAQRDLDMPFFHP